MGKIQLNEQLAKAQQTRAQRAMASEKKARAKALNVVHDFSYAYVPFTAVVRALAAYRRAILKAHQ